MGLIDGYFCQGIVYQSLGNYEQSINAYNQVIELDSTNILYYQLRGHVYFALKNYPKAIADITKAIELDPQDDSLYFQRKNYYSLMNQIELAIKDISKAIEIKPNNAQYYYDRADLKSNNLFKRWKDVDYLKQNLWGEKLIQDAKILLETPQMKQL